MLESTRKKLGALKLPARAIGGSPPAARLAARAPKRGGRKAPAAAASRQGPGGAELPGSHEPHAEPLGVEAYLPGGELATPHGPIYLHERRRSELDRGTGVFLRRLAAVQKRALKLDVHEELAHLLGEGLHKALFIDLETTGLSQTPVFLVGAMTAGRTDWTLRQYFARNYAEEEALVRHTFELLRERPILVTFNGRTFDWPFLKMRAAYHRIPLGPEPLHVDLLRHARRHWKGAFDNCKLQTLEWRVVGRRRTGDVGGAEIPQRYHDFVKSRDPYPLVPVFHHNMLDLVAMADILVAMLEREVGEEES